MRAPHLSDDQKEAHVRRAALGLLRSFVRITLIGAVALAVPAAIVWIGSALDLYHLSDAIELATGWPFILGATVVLVAIWGITGKTAARKAPKGPMPGVPYGRTDRMLHRVAFASPNLQKSLADLETRRFRDAIDPEFAKDAVFITSLPRAGTTVMLDILADLPEFASATYRAMPFTLTPLLWGSLTRRPSAKGRGRRACAR